MNICLKNCLTCYCQQGKHCLLPRVGAHTIQPNLASIHLSFAIHQPACHGSQATIILDYSHIIAVTMHTFTMLLSLTPIKKTLSNLENYLLLDSQRSMAAFVSQLSKRTHTHTQLKIIDREG